MMQTLKYCNGRLRTRIVDLTLRSYESNLFPAVSGSAFSFLHGCSGTESQFHVNGLSLLESVASGKPLGLIKPVMAQDMAWNRSAQGSLQISRGIATSAYLGKKLHKSTVRALKRGKAARQVEETHVPAPDATGNALEPTEEVLPSTSPPETAEVRTVMTLKS